MSRELPAAACWQFDLSDALAFLGAGKTSGAADWRQEDLERFLALVRVEDVSDAALLLFDLPRDRAMARPIGSLWPQASLIVLSDLLAALANADSDTVLSRWIDRTDRCTDIVLVGWRAIDAAWPHRVFVSIEATLDPVGALLAPDAGQPRRRSLISSVPLPLWDVDARAAGRIFDRLRADGVADLDDYLSRHPDLIDIATEVVVVTEANRDAVELMGASEPSELMRPVRYLFTIARETARRIMLSHFAGQRNHVEQAKVRTFDGRVRDVLFLVTFPVPGEQLDTTLLMLIDNTAQLEAETRLRQVEADFSHAARLSTLGQMTASIAHEIKQPLAAILTSAETSLRWLAKDDPNLPKVIQLSQRIAASAQRANDIIARIQDMAGKRQPQHVRLDLNEVVREAVNFVRHDSEERSIRLRLHLAEEPLFMTGERVQLQQVVVNLLVNSAQALEAADAHEREISVITYRVDAATVAFCVRDTGPGIPEHDIERIFGGFFSTKEGGMGIGLTICQSIVSAHGGRITAASAPGRGAEFRVVLPSEPCTAEIPVAPLSERDGDDPIPGYALALPSGPIDHVPAPT